MHVNATPSAASSPSMRPAPGHAAPGWGSFLPSSPVQPRQLPAPSRRHLDSCAERRLFGGDGGGLSRRHPGMVTEHKHWNGEAYGGEHGAMALPGTGTGHFKEPLQPALESGAHARSDASYSASARKALLHHRSQGHFVNMVGRFCDSVQQSRLQVCFAGWSSVGARRVGRRRPPVAPIVHGCLQAWSAWSHGRQRERIRSARMAAALERRERSALLHDCLRCWRAPAAGSGQTGRLAAMDEQLHAEAKQLRKEVEESRARADRAEIELVRRSKDEFTRLRQLQGEFMELQSRVPALSRTSDDTPPAARLAQGARSNHARLESLAKPRPTASSASGVVDSLAAAATQACLRLCLSAWCRHACTRGLVLALVQQGAGADCAARSGRALAAWQLAISHRHIMCAAARLIDITCSRQAESLLCVIMYAWHTATRELSRLTTPMSHRIVGGPPSGATPLSQRMFDGPISGASPFDNSLGENPSGAVLQSWAQECWKRPDNDDIAGTPPRFHNGAPPEGSPWESVWPAPSPVGGGPGR
mmetsp:Transcript_7588/g.21224  ORF Transcript_7588/g.21224 Transcript_7588/m.21224 type:complete len:533 (-) Transcript_7588:69-1667(-)